MGFNGLGFYKVKVLRSRLTGLLVFRGASPLYLLTVPAVQFLSLMGLRRASGFFFKLSLLPTSLNFYHRTLQLFFFTQVLTLSFTGKGYKLVKNRLNTLTFSFGHSHIYYVYNPQLLFLFRTKTRGYFVGLTRFILMRGFSKLFGAKPINIFTGRGVRARKQIIFRKVGKLSLYM
uniref:ribosomal protein L6 n=1 Tax=Euplotes cristatus TaxID=756077 RepID=UPI002E787526|nr:ribosomal protein L6 [Euplotes cristatus]UPM52083.1 ribosomal protein L6 [Euplotes cristatus]